MASILKVDTIQDQDGNNIISEAANTITIGASGDTITIPSGATLDTSNSTVTLPDGSVTSAKISYPLTTFSSTGIDDNATSTAITIDSSERVGIGATPSSGAKLDIYDGGINVDTTGGALTTTRYTSGTGANNIIVQKSQSATIGTHTALSNGSGIGGIITKASDGTSFIPTTQITSQVDGTVSTNSVPSRIIFSTNGGSTTYSERMRIDSSGNVLVGTTTFNSDVENLATDSLAISQSNGKLLIHSSSQPLELARTSGDTNSRDMVQFWREGSQVGKITTDGTSTSYLTSSDYRLKENVSYDFDATTRLKQLKPARFNFIADADRTVDGFLAHEVSSIVPEAISGTYNETETKEKVVVNSNGQVIAQNIEQADWEAGKIADEEGNTQYPTDSTWEATKVVPVYQGIDQSKLVPLLVKTIQELEARITALETQP